MNTIGIDNNLDRPRIKKLLVIGLFASFLTGIGDFMLGYGAAENMENYGLVASVLASAPNLADWQMIAGGLFGFFGIFLEGLAYFAIYRLMADAAPKYAHLYRAGIFGYIWLAPVGCHMSVGVQNLAFKYLLRADNVLAAIFGLNSALGSAIGTMFLSFGNAFMFGGLLATLPDQEAFDRFREMYRTGPITAAVAGKSI